MNAVRLHQFGPPENLRYEEVEDPVPAEGQVRIAVGAAGVHLIDTGIRAGHVEGPLPQPELPAVPGREVAGVIDAVGPGVDRAWLGQRAVAHLGEVSGGYAELAVREAAAVHGIPDGLSDEAAVALIGTGRTAVAVLDVASPGPADVVLVTAAASGLGTLLVQGTRHAGATVVGVAGGPAKVRQMRANGATVAVDYLAPGWDGAVRDALAGRDVTVVLDGVGGDLGRTALELLGTGGRLVLFGWSAGTPTELSAGDLYRKGMTATAAIGPRIQQWPGGLRALEEQALAAGASGLFVPVVTRFALSDAAGAHRAVESRATVGKTVLIP